MLTGAELLAKLKELGDLPRSELVRGCGYVSLSKNVRQRLKFNAFYAALLEAKGLTFRADPKRRGTRGRKLTYCTKVHFNGNLLVGCAYTAQLDVKPGDEFEIRLGKNQIRLVPVGGIADDEDAC